MPLNCVEQEVSTSFFMNQSAILLSITLLGIAACRPAPTDGANDAGGTASPYLARQVVGVHMLSNDANYDKASNLLAEELVRGTFKLGGTTELAVEDTRQGGVFSWGKNQVEIAFATPRPYPSIYHAEHVFDRVYQNGPAATMTTVADPDMAGKGPLSGPATEGTAAEYPAESATGTINQRDKSTKNDTATSISGVTAAATQLTPPAASTRRYAAYPGLGDKAVWDASTKTMHILLNNHILNLRVNTADNMEVSRERAAILANVILDKIIGKD